MGKRGPKPKGKVHIVWSPNFAYAIGLLASDGSVSNDGRHIDFTSNDREQLRNFASALKIDATLTHKKSGMGHKVMRIQFSDVYFHTFLISIGVMPAKSKVLGKIKVPSKYFFDFLRGSFDGDGSFYSYYDPRWKTSFMFYLVFISASNEHIHWLRNELKTRLGVWGHVTGDGRVRTLQLKYGKREALKILKNMYYSDSVLCLSRKRVKIEKGLKEAEKTK
jgi:hypothetical protein